MPIRFTYHFFLCVLFFLGCIPMKNLQKEMVKIDEAIVPIWYELRKGDLHQAKASLLVLSYRWQQFKYKTSFTQEEWQTSIQLIDDWLCDLTISVEMNQQQQAMIQLDHAIYTLMEVRRKYKLTNHLDRFWDVQMTYDEVYDIVHDPMILRYDWQEFEQRVALLNNQWCELKLHAPNSFLAWENEKQIIYYTYIAILDELFETFNTTVACGDLEYIALTCEDIQAPLENTIALFGNFTDTKIYYATR